MYSLWVCVCVECMRVCVRASRWSGCLCVCARVDVCIPMCLRACVCSSCVMIFGCACACSKSLVDAIRADVNASEPDFHPDEMTPGAFTTGKTDASKASRTRKK